MSPQPLLCYITDRAQFAGYESARRKRLLEKVAEAARAGVDYIQLREKDLSARELEELAREAIRVLQDEKRRAGNQGQRTVFLINSRTDVALAVGAQGVHLRSDDITPADVRHICSRWANGSARLMISQSCHRPNDVQQAAKNGADLVLFAPVFEKKDSPNTSSTGLDALHQACQHDIPVLALGGVTLENAARCFKAGAAGIAGIRLFQDHDIAEMVQRLRSL